MGRAYVCNRWPSLGIRQIKFVGGFYRAKSKEEEKIIESADGFGVHIFHQDAIPEPVDSDEETQALAAVNAALLEPQVRQGRRGSR